MKTFEAFYPFNKMPIAKTPREVRLEKLVKECIPHILREELSTRTSPKLRSLLERMKKEIDEQLP